MMAVLRSKTVLFLFLFATAQLYGQSGKFYYFIDSNSRFSIQDTSSFEWQKGCLSKNLSLGYNENMTVWCKLVVNNSYQDQNYFWAFNNIHLDSIKFFRKDQPTVIAGDRVRGRSPYLNSYTCAANNDGSVEQIVIACVKKQWSFLDFSVSLTDQRTLTSSTETSLALFFLFGGFAVMMLLLNFYIYIQTKQVSQIYYIIYSFIGVIYVAVNMGVAKNFFFPDFIYFSEFRIFSGCYWYLFLGIFISEILELKKSAKNIYRFIMSFQWIVGFLSFFSIVCLALKAYRFLLLPSYITYLIFFLNILLLAMGVYHSVRHKHPKVKYVIFAFFPHILWGLNMILSAFRIVETDLSKNWISLIILYEMMLFGGLLIRDYIDTFRKIQILQEKLLAEERGAILAIDQARIKERRLLSDILHDKAGVLIARTMYQLEMERSDEAKGSLTELGSFMRSLSHSVMPISLDDGALKGALQDQIHFIKPQIKPVDLEFYAYDFPERIDRDLASSLYLISLELIQNALKHGKPQRIVVELFCYPDQLVLSCDDDGSGFSDNESKGFGLQNIERRVQIFSGDLSINSSIEIGTTILITIPNNQP